MTNEYTKVTQVATSWPGQERYCDIEFNSGGSSYLVNISPNPSLGDAILNIEILKDDIYTIGITDPFGRKIKDILKQEYLAKGEYNFNLATYSKGLLLITVVSQNNKQSVHKFIRM